MSETLFPDISPQAQEVLYILGNGFDICHGIDSRYSDFERWVETKGNDRLFPSMENMWPYMATEVYKR